MKSGKTEIAKEKFYAGKKTIKKWDVNVNTVEPVLKSTSIKRPPLHNDQVIFGSIYTAQHDHLSNAQPTTTF